MMNNFVINQSFHQVLLIHRLSSIQYYSHFSLKFTMTVADMNACMFFRLVRKIESGRFYTYNQMYDHVNTFIDVLD